MSVPNEGQRGDYPCLTVCGDVCDISAKTISMIHQTAEAHSYANETGDPTKSCALAALSQRNKLVK